MEDDEIVAVIKFPNLTINVDSFKNFGIVLPTTIFWIKKRIEDNKILYTSRDENADENFGNTTIKKVAKKIYNWLRSDECVRSVGKYEIELR